MFISIWILLELRSHDVQFGASHCPQYLESSNLPSTPTYIAEVVHAFGLLARSALPLLLGLRLSGFALLASFGGAWTRNLRPHTLVFLQENCISAAPWPLSSSSSALHCLHKRCEPGRVIIFLLHLPTCLAFLAALA